MGFRVSRLTANILVDGKEQQLIRTTFQCRDTLIPQIQYKMAELSRLGKLSVTREQYFELQTLNRKPSSWDDIMGNNAHVSPLASPFLLRFYIGRVRNGYQYAKLERALRIAGEQGVEFPRLEVAWNLGSWNLGSHRGAEGLGLGNILPTVRGGWNHTSIDYARIFPPYKFL